MSSSFTRKYQYQQASAKPYTHFWSFQILLVLASFGGRKWTVLSIWLPWRKAVLTSIAWTFHLFQAIKTNIDWTPNCKQHGESVGNSFISKPRAQSLAFVTFSLFLILWLKTHLTEMHDSPVSSSSQYTSCFF